ncbi:MAG: glycosyltransferase family 4 protein [Acidobacteria bacterium]|nr:glycosyltransferase family 4 protein [Acidobacteriota bacterium]
MKRVAIVVQRSHESIAGGSESLALQYAALLEHGYEVEVLTTTALDIPTWSNALSEGTERLSERITLRRFRVTVGRTSYWFSLNTRLQKDFELYGVGRARFSEGARLPWSLALQEEYIRRQGPYSAPLMKFLRERWADYQSIIFVTYLYPTTYFGLFEIPERRGLVVPTLHDEQPAYLSAYKYMVRRARRLLWLTEAERRLGLELWGDLPGEVTAMSIETALRKPARESAPYLLYCGRVDPNKGCPELFDYFSRFKKEHPSSLRLVLIGEKTMALPAHKDVEFRGFVETEEKFRLMAGAKLFVMPSRHESFSIVTLEAMGQRTPVLACGDCEVLVDHVTRSHAGKLYNDYESFASGLKQMLSDEDELAKMGGRGREYIVSHFERERVRKSLIEAVESCAEVEAGAARAVESR